MGAGDSSRTHSEPSLGTRRIRLDDPRGFCALHDKDDGLHVCFVALKALAALGGGAIDGQIGGAEVQQALLARGLAKRGFRVSLIAFDSDVARDRVIDGVRVIPAFTPNGGLPGVRFLHPRWTGLHRALRTAAADVYYQRGAGCETGQTALYCGRAGARFVFAAGSDSDCEASLHYLRSRRDKWLYRYGLSRADAVLAQTDHQHARLAANFNVDAVVVRSCAPRTFFGEAEKRPQSSSPRLLWVGRFSYEKRPEWILDVAERRPSWRVDIVGAANSSSEYARSIVRRARALANVTLHGATPHIEMPRFYDAADVLVCTSHWEGFPNTYLEAWSRGTPAVATVDPDGLILRHALGATGASPDELAIAIEGIVGDTSAYARMSQRCREHVRAHHNPDRVLDAFERILEVTASQPVTVSG